MEGVKPNNGEMGPGDIFQLRTKLKMTQRQFADLVGVDPVTVSRWERGHTRMERAMISHVRLQTQGYKQRAS
jgi:DNA-binding transcriptional regulator YiaG